jgi:hypothetical protein
MKIKMFLGFCLLFVFVAWNVNAADVTITDPKLEVALREALEDAGVAGGPHGGSWLPPIADGAIDSDALSDDDFAVDLDISNLGITSLNGLEAATKLTGLNASGNAITSLSYGTGADAKSVLGGLTNATSIDLSNNLIASLTYAGTTPAVHSVLADLSACTELNLSNNRIVNLAYAADTTTPLVLSSVLEDVTDCTDLNLSNNLIVVLSYLGASAPKDSVFGTLTDLEVLNLNNNLIASPTEFSYIGISTNLTELYVSNNRIAGVLPNISSLASLVKLQLNGNLITDFSKLDPTAFSDLVYLDISNNAGASIGIRRINPVVGGPAVTGGTSTFTVEFDVASVPTLYGISFKLHFESTANVTASGGSVVGSVLGTPLISSFNYPAAAATSGDVGISISKQGVAAVIANGKLATVNLLLANAAGDVKLTFVDVNALTSTGNPIAICIPPLASYVIAKPNTAFVTVCPGDTDDSKTVTASDLTGIANCWGYHADAVAGVRPTARLADSKTPALSTYLTTWFPQVAPIGTAGAGLWTTASNGAVGNADVAGPPIVYSSTKAARADCNGDGIVDEKDVLVVALNFGKLATNYTPPAAPSLQSEGYSLPVLNELLNGVKSMPRSEARDKMISVLKDAITQTQRAFVPKETVALQNYPNPFNPETWLPFQLVKDANVNVRIFDASGKLVRSLELGRKAAGSYLTKDLAAYWDGKTAAGEQVSSGVYFYNIQAGDYSATRKMIVNK